MTEPLILAIDGYNFIHRARGGFKLGDHPVCFNFFRNLRSIVEQFKPTRVYFITEGVPVKRLDAFEDYKGNRRTTTLSDEEATRLMQEDPKAYAKLIAKTIEMDNFYRQKDLIINLLKTTFPVSVMRHPQHEADDVIYNLIKRSTRAVPWVVASNDSDFTQLLNEFDNVKVYNPMTKEFFDKPDYDYVDWKSLRGDDGDNIPGIPGVGDVTADRMMGDPAFRKEFFETHPLAEAVWVQNFDLIKFFEFSDHELSQVESSEPVHDWEKLRAAFQEWKFNSLLKDKSWDAYIATFDKLWGPHDQ